MMKEQEYENIKGIVHNDFLDKPATNTIYYGQPDEYIHCPHCGELAKLDPEILTSLPPQRRYRCAHCGEIGTIYCHEAQIIIDPNWKPWFGAEDEKQPEPILHSYTHCLICGASIPVSLTEAHTKICDNCKEAVLAIRKLMGTYHD